MCKHNIFSEYQMMPHYRSWRTAQAFVTCNIEESFREAFWACASCHAGAAKIG